MPSSGRWCSVTKALLTNNIYDSQSGGKFRPELKFAGFDILIIEGKAELRGAKHIWGKMFMQLQT